MNFFLCLQVLLSLLSFVSHARRLIEKESNLTELLDAFSNGMENAIDPISNIPLSDRLLAFRQRLDAYGLLDQAVREEFALDDGNRLLGYVVMAENLALSTW